MPSLFVPYINELLSKPSSALGLSRLSITIYLFLVFIIYLAITIIFILLQTFNKCVKNNQAKSNFSHNFILVILIINILLILIGLASSLGLFYYSLVLVLAVLIIPITTYLISLINNDSKVEFLSIIFAILVIFIFASRDLVTGIAEQETTSDAINIYLNGYFRWSIHASWYDLAPLDAILNVILSYVTGRSIFNAALASAMYFSYGLMAFLLLYALVKKITGNPALSISIMLLSMLSYPYSPIIGLSVPPDALSQLLALTALIMLMKPPLGYGEFKMNDYIVTVLLIISAIFMHPTALTIPIYLALIIILLYYRKELNKYRYLVYITLLALMIYLSKVAYTAFTLGFTNYLQVLWSYIINAFIKKEYASIVTGNLGYSSLPRLSLTGFVALPGFIGGLTLPLILKMIRKRPLSLVEQLFFITTIFYAAFLLASLLTGIGGISQSRVIMVGAEHYMEFALIIYLAALLSKSRKRLILIPLLLVSLSTLITPSAMPLNYTIGMSAKGATINDHIIAYTFTGLIDKNYFVKLYDSCGNLGRIVAMQVEGNYYYGLGSTQAITYYFIAPRVIPAKTYWDGCLMAIGSIPKNAGNYVRDRVFSGWVYAYYLYIPIR